MESYSITKNGKFIKGVSKNSISSLTITNEFDNFGDYGIWNVKTKLKYRGKGYCYKLLKFVLQWKRNYYLLVNLNNTNAINLYKRLGFLFDENCVRMMTYKHSNRILFKSKSGSK